MLKKAVNVQFEEKTANILKMLMEGILHHLIFRVSQYVRGFIHPRWLFGISEPSTFL